MLKIIKFIFSNLNNTGCIGSYFLNYIFGFNFIISEIPIETRDPKEVSSIWGVDENKNMKTISIVPENSKSVNYAFDVTPSKYISKLITEKGIVDPNEKSIITLKNK